jgi:putative endonuclease
MRTYYVYILASKSRRLYVGVTNNLERRVCQHRNGLGKFTSQYRINRLVHFEEFSHPMEAIEREKRIKSFLRSRKIKLIESKNPAWDDLAGSWYPNPALKPGGTA